MNDREGSRPEGVDAPRSVLDQPLRGPIDRLADHAVSRTHRSSVWAPVLIAAGGLLAMIVVFVAIGEAITHLSLLAGLRGTDEQVNAHLSAHRTSGWNRFSEFWSQSAETVPIVAGALVVEAVLAARRRWRDLLLVVVGLVVELATFLAVNQIVRRARPDVQTLGIVPVTFSFPSGHTAATVVLYGSVVVLLTLHVRSRWVRVLAWIPVAALTFAVGYARVYRGMHHVSDVVAGAVMGAGALLVAVTAARASSLAARPTEVEGFPATEHQAPVPVGAGEEVYAS